MTRLDWTILWDRLYNKLGERTTWGGTQIRSLMDELESDMIMKVEQKNDQEPDSDNLVFRG